MCTKIHTQGVNGWGACTCEEWGTSIHVLVPNVTVNIEINLSGRRDPWYVAHYSIFNMCSTHFFISRSWWKVYLFLQKPKFQHRVYKSCELELSLNKLNLSHTIYQEFILILSSKLSLEYSRHYIRIYVRSYLSYRIFRRQICIYGWRFPTFDQVSAFLGC